MNAYLVKVLSAFICCTRDPLEGNSDCGMLIRSIYAIKARYSAASRSCLRIWAKEMCYVLAIVLSILLYLLGSSNCSLKSSVSAPVYVNNDIYSETDVSLLLIKAAACTIVSGR
jgi:hypothetical protein